MRELSNNELVGMTRRNPPIKDKQRKRDSKISARIVQAWDIEGNAEKVLEIFLKEKDNLSSYRYWEILRSVWILAGSLETIDIFYNLFRAPKPNRYYFSTPEEAQKRRSLPEMFIIYRATNDPFDGGLSWTLSRDYALWYARKFSKSRVIYMTIYKEAVFAVIDRNKESEILLWDPIKKGVHFFETINF